MKRKAQKIKTIKFKTYCRDCPTQRIKNSLGNAQRKERGRSEGKYFGQIGERYKCQYRSFVALQHQLDENRSP